MQSLADDLAADLAAVHSLCHSLGLGTADWPELPAGASTTEVQEATAAACLLLQEAASQLQPSGALPRRILVLCRLQCCL